MALMDIMLQLQREPRATETQADAMVRLATEHAICLWTGFGNLFRGWALAQQGAEDEGLAQIQTGLSMWRATGAEALVPYFLGLFG